MSRENSAGFRKECAAADYTVWRDSLGSTGTLLADGNGNGVIDAGDLQIWNDRFGEVDLVNGAAAAAGSPRSAPIPEPTSLVLAALAALAFSSPSARRFAKSTAR